MVKSQALFRGWCRKTTNVAKKQQNRTCCKKTTNPRIWSGIQDSHLVSKLDTYFVLLTSRNWSGVSDLHRP